VQKERSGREWKDQFTNLKKGESPVLKYQRAQEPKPPSGFAQTNKKATKKENQAFTKPVPEFLSGKKKKKQGDFGGTRTEGEGKKRNGDLLHEKTKEHVGRSLTIQHNAGPAASGKRLKYFYEKRRWKKR